MPEYCSHFDQVRPVEPGTQGCAECLQTGDTWVHLRLASPAATSAAATARRTARDPAFPRDGPSGDALAEPGETWGWCYVHEQLRPDAPDPVIADLAHPLSDAGSDRLARRAAAAMTRDAFRRVFPGVMVAMFLAAADQTILASALPAIASSLGGINDLSWVVVGYLLAATVAAPLYGYLGDRFGRRRMLLGALGVFTLASVACAFAPNFLWLVLFRALQGLGGGGLMTLAQALIGEHVSPRERGRFAGYFATVFALASTTGPVLGAYLTEHFSWRAVFADQRAARHRRRRARVARAARADAGACAARSGPTSPARVLFCATTATFLFTLSSGGHRFAWLSWPTAALLACAAAGLRRARRVGAPAPRSAAAAAPPARAGDRAIGRRRHVLRRRALLGDPRTCRSTCSSGAAWASARRARCCCRSRSRRSSPPR